MMWIRDVYTRLDGTSLLHYVCWDVDEEIVERISEPKQQQQQHELKQLSKDAIASISSCNMERCLSIALAFFPTRLPPCVRIG